MNRRSVRCFVFAAAFAAVLALSACGNKGPLVLPGAPADTPVPAEPAPAADASAPPSAAGSDAKPPSR